MSYWSDQTSDCRSLRDPARALVLPLLDMAFDGFLARDGFRRGSWTWCPSWPFSPSSRTVAGYARDCFRAFPSCVPLLVENINRNRRDRNGRSTPSRSPWALHTAPAAQLDWQHQGTSNDRAQSRERSGWNRRRLTVSARAASSVRRYQDRRRRRTRGASWRRSTRDRRPGYFSRFSSQDLGLGASPGSPRL